MFTEFKFDIEMIRELAAEKAANLKANKGFSDLEGFALGVIARRLASSPDRYRDYGPYWWAIKELLRASGADMGDRDDAAIRAEYGDESGVNTIVMADAFRSMYLARWPVGTNQFTLDSESGDIYTLEDSDMEQLATIQ